MVSSVEQILLIFIRAILPKFSFKVLKNILSFPTHVLNGKNHQLVKFSFIFRFSVVLVLKLIHGLFSVIPLLINWDRTQLYVLPRDTMFS